MRRALAVSLVAFAASCASNPADAFEFQVRFAPGDATLVVDGIQAPDELTFTFDSYDEAQRRLELVVEITTATDSAIELLRPGHCANEVLASYPSVGELVGEALRYEVLAEPTTPALALTSYVCRGTVTTIQSTP